MFGKKSALLLMALAIVGYIFVSNVQVADASRSFCQSILEHARCSNNDIDRGTICYDVGCDTNADCSDGNLATTDTCVNPGSATYCRYSNNVCSYCATTHTSGCCPNCGGVASYCTHSACSSGTKDCDGKPTNGCEAVLVSDSNNCGACGHTCTVGQVCQSGSCVTPTDFSVIADPNSGIANKGDSKTTNITVNLTGGTAMSTSLSATGLPAGTSASFGPTTCTPNCYSNMTITTTASTPTGSSIITVSGTAGSVVKTATYNLTVLPNSCNHNNVCEYPETQATCGPSVANDCNTTATMSSPVSPGDIATVSVEFWDFRYQANEKVRISLNIDGITPWTSSNGCFFGGVRMGPTSGGDGTIAWPSGTISTAGHFKITTSCQVPNTITAGAHTLVATPTII